MKLQRFWSSTTRFNSAFLNLLVQELSGDHLYLEWNSEFNGQPDLIQSQANSSLIYSSAYKNAIYVHDSSFIECHYASFGGSIYYSSNENCKILVEMCTFHNTTANGHGGAIAIFTGGQSVIKKCCGNHCYIIQTSVNTWVGEFIYTYVSNRTNYKNYFDDCSISKSMQDEETPGQRCVIWLQYGVVKVDVLNSSFSTNKINPGLYSQHLSSSNQKCSLKFCYIYHNIATANTIMCVSTVENSELEYSNLIDNIDQGYQGLIRITGPGIIRNCCILNNTALYIVFGDHHISVSNCTIDTINLTESIYGIVDISHWLPESTFINQIACTYDNKYCFALDSEIYEQESIGLSVDTQRLLALISMLYQTNY